MLSMMLQRMSKEKLKKESIAIESLLKNAEVVDDAEEGTINIGCKVKLFDKEFDEEVEYMIVGSTEANSIAGVRFPTSLR